MARPRGVRTRGCHIEARKGKGRLVFRWEGKLIKLTTALPPTSPQLLGARDQIGWEIRAGTFDPNRWFPSRFSPDPLLKAKPTTLAEDMALWVAEVEEWPTVRAALKRDYRSHLRAYFQPGPLAQADPRVLSLGEVKGLFKWMLTQAPNRKTKGKGLSEATCKKVLDGTLRAYLRDRGYSRACVEGLKWSHPQGLVQTPFLRTEVEAILGWFRAHRPPEQYLSIALRFQGITPSEARGLRGSDLHPAQGCLFIARSQYRGQEAGTKTRARQRPVQVEEGLMGELLALAEGCPSGPLFPFSEWVLGTSWRHCLKALGVPFRTLYQCKHTYAVLALQAGAVPSTVARNLGISMATLEKNYAAALRRLR